MPIPMSRTEHAEFARLIEPHLASLYRAAYRLTGNRPDAEDLVQDVCVRAYANLRSLEDLERPKSWLMKIQYRMFVDGARRAGGRRYVPRRTTSTRHARARIRASKKSRKARSPSGASSSR